MVLTKTDLKAIKKIVNDIVIDASETILNAVGSMFDDRDKRFDGVDKRFDGMDKRFDKVDERLDKLETNQHYIRDDIKGLKSDLSDTVRMKRFNQLKRKVYRHHPAN